MMNYSLEDKNENKVSILGGHLTKTDEAMLGLIPGFVV